MTEAVLSVEALWKRFGFRRALAGVDLDIAARSSFAIFGHNGAGKSTLLKILATRARPSSGKVTVGGEDAVRYALRVRRRLGVVFHESCLRGNLTLDENLRYYAGLFGVEARTDRVDALIERLGLSSRRGDPVRGFSQGMLKRATLVRSLLHDPEIWLLDEPFSGLDPDGRRELESLMTSERDAGRTVVFITHDVEQGLRLADDAALLRHGEIAARGLESVRAALARDSRASHDSQESQEPLRGGAA